MSRIQLLSASRPEAATFLAMWVSPQGSVHVVLASSERANVGTEMKQREVTFLEATSPHFATFCLLGARHWVQCTLRAGEHTRVWVPGGGHRGAPSQAALSQSVIWELAAAGREGTLQSYQAISVSSPISRCRIHILCSVISYFQLVSNKPKC